MQRRLLSLWFVTGTPLIIKTGTIAQEMSLERLALWCQAFTPLTAVDPPDGILLDITGCAHLFGGEMGLRTRLDTLLPQARTAIANTASASWALVRFGQKGTKLDDLPIAALRVSDNVIAKLRRLGIRRIGELARLSRGDIRAGFPADLLLRLDRLRGIAPEAIRFLSAPCAWRELEYHADPLFTADQLKAALDRLATTLCRRLAQADLGLTGLMARFHRVDAQLVEDRIGFAAPTRDAAHIIKLLTERLQTIDPGFGIEAIALEADVAPLALAQPELDQPPPRDDARTIDRLMRRVRLSRFAAIETHIPEQMARLVPVSEPPCPWPAPAHPRPVRLLERPERISVIAPVPDDPPRLMQWRGITHHIVRATGPERIARDWWRYDQPESRAEAERVRDYYVVENNTGRCFWVFRSGLHEGEAAPRWFVHGLF